MLSILAWSIRRASSAARAADFGAWPNVAVGTSSRATVRRTPRNRYSAMLTSPPGDGDHTVRARHSHKPKMPRRDPGPVTLVALPRWQYLSEKQNPAP